MARYVVLFLAAWGAKVEAQPVVVPVVAPVEKVCPTLGSSVNGLELETEPWTFMRTIQVKSTAVLFGEGAAVTAAPTEAQPQTSQLLGKIVSVFAWTSTYALNDAHDKMISKIVNPGSFWDTTKDIYNCNDVKMGSLNYIFEWSQLWTNRYVKHKVLDASGNHVAYMSQVEAEGSNFFSSRQHMVFLEDLAGTALASMRKPVGGFSNLGAWSEKLSVQIDSSSLNPLAPPMDPEFIILIFGNVLGMDSHIGPYCSLIINALIYSFLLFVIICSTCCGGKDDAREQIRATASEEKETLLGGHGSQAQQVENKGKSFWNCCSRRVAPEQSAKKAEGAVKKEGDSASSAAHGAAASAHGH